MIPQGIPIFLAVQPVDMRLGFERLGGLVRERMEHNPRSRAHLAFVGKRGNTMKILTWDGSGVVPVHKKLDAGKFEIPKPAASTPSNGSGADIGVPCGGRLQYDPSVDVTTLGLSRARHPESTAVVQSRMA